MSAAARRAIGQETKAVSSSAVALTSSLFRQVWNATEQRYISARYASIKVEDDQVRMTLDGTTPTSTVGQLLNPGDAVVLEHQDQIFAARFIRVGGDASLKVIYFE